MEDYFKHFCLIAKGTDRHISIVTPKLKYFSLSANSTLNNKEKSYGQFYKNNKNKCHC